MRYLLLTLIILFIGFTHQKPTDGICQTPNTNVIKVVKYDEFGGAYKTVNLNRSLADSVEGLNAYIHDSITMAIDTAQIRALHKSRAGWGIVKDSTPTSITFNADPALLMPRAEAEPVIDSYGSMIGARVKYTDTPAMLAPYVKRWLADLLYQPMIGYTPENTANKVTNFSSPNNTTFPTSAAVNGLVSNYYLASNPSGYITGINSSMVNAALGYTPYNSSNPAGYITSVPAQTWASITGKPTSLSGYGITDAYPLTGNPSSFLTGNQTISFAPTGDVTGSTSGTTSLAPTLTIGNSKVTNAMLAGSIANAKLANSSITLNNVSVSLGGSATITPVYTTTVVTRPINGTTFTIHPTLPGEADYYASISCTATIGSAAAGSLEFQYSTNGGSTWIPYGVISNSNTVTLALTLNSVQITGGLIHVKNIPPGALCRLVQTTSGTTTITYTRGYEYY